MPSEKMEMDSLCKIVGMLAKNEDWKEARMPCDYMVFDLETLGFEPSNDMIVQIGFCVVRDCQVVHDLWPEDYKSVILKWPKECFVGKEGAINVHHIDYERSQKDGIDPREAFELMTDIVKFGNEEGMMFSGHNLFAFDFGFMKTAMANLQFDLHINRSQLIDTAMIVKGMRLGMIPGPDENIYDYYSRVKRFRAKGVFYNLDRYCVERFELRQRYGVEPENAHDAGYDCYLTHLVVECLNKMIDGEWNG